MWLGYFLPSSGQLHVLEGSNLRQILQKLFQVGHQYLLMQQLVVCKSVEFVELEQVSRPFLSQTCLIPLNLVASSFLSSNAWFDLFRHDLGHDLLMHNPQTDSCAVPRNHLNVLLDYVAQHPAELGSISLLLCLSCIFYCLHSCLFMSYFLVRVLKAQEVVSMPVIEHPCLELLKVHIVGFILAFQSTNWKSTSNLFPFEEISFLHCLFATLIPQEYHFHLLFDLSFQAKKWWLPCEFETSRDHHPNHLLTPSIILHYWFVAVKAH